MHLVYNLLQGYSCITHSVTVMSVNFSLLFYLKKSNSYLTGPVPIYLRVTVAGKRAEIFTGRKCEPNRWNASAGRAWGTKAATKSLNIFLDNLQAKVYEVHQQLVETEEPITAVGMKNRFIGMEDKERVLIELFEEHNRKMGALMWQACFC